MPQMMPMNWIMLMIYFILMFIIFNIINYFMFNPKINNMNNLINKLNFKKMNWKW